MAKGLQAFAYLVVNLGDRRIDRIRLREVDAQQQALVGGDPTAQGLNDLAAAGTDPGSDPAGESLGVGLTPCQGVEDRSSTLPP